jgi:hypothetical protein
MPANAPRLGTLMRESRSRRRAASRNDHIHLFSSPVNAARLREAIENSRSGRNMISMTMEELEALFRHEAPRGQ